MKIIYKTISIIIIIICLVNNVTSVYAASESKSGNIVDYSDETIYTTVYLTKNKTAKIKIYAYNCYGKTVTRHDSIRIIMTDNAGNTISEFNTKNGSTLKLGNDHSIYRIYIKKTFTETFNPTTNKKKIITSWKLKTISNCSFDYNKSIEKNQQSSINNNAITPEKSGYIIESQCKYIISPKHAQNMVIDISGGNSSIYNGNNVLIWGLYNNYAKSRQFKFIPVGNGWYKIENVNSGLVLDVDCSNGNVIQYKYHGGNNQLWKVEDAGNGYYYIRCKETDINGVPCYLDIANGDKTDGTNVIVWHKNNSNNQKFKLRKVK